MINSLVMPLMQKHITTDSRFLRGRIVNEYRNLTGQKKSAFYDNLKIYKQCNGMLELRPPQIRIPKSEHAERILEVTLIAKVIGNMHCSTETARDLLAIEGQIKHFAQKDRTVIEKFMKRIGITYHMIRERSKRATKWIADYPYQIVMIDASPMEQYFMTFKDQIEMHQDIDFRDKHNSDRMWKMKLRKIWGYYIVDVFSHAFLVFYIADDPMSVNARQPGESGYGWIKAMRYFMGEKEHLGLPQFGVPDMIYSDKGSGILSNEFRSFAFTLNHKTQLKTHDPKDPSAKGIVEGRIGGWKRSTEVMFQRGAFSNIREMQALAEKFMYSRQSNEQFALLREGLKNHPARYATEKNFRDASITSLQRKTSAYGTVSIDGKEWYIPTDCPQNIYITIYFRDGKTFAILPNNRQVELQPHGAIGRKMDFTFTDGRKPPKKSDRQRIMDEIQTETKRKKKTVTIHPETIQKYAKIDGEVETAPHNGVEIETFSQLKVESFFSTKEALDYIQTQAGDIQIEYKTTWENLFKRALETIGEIPIAMIEEMIKELR